MSGERLGYVVVEWLPNFEDELQISEGIGLWRDRADADAACRIERQTFEHANFRFAVAEVVLPDGEEIR